MCPVRFGCAPFPALPLYRFAVALVLACSSRFVVLVLSWRSARFVVLPAAPFRRSGQRTVSTIAPSASRAAVFVPQELALCSSKSESSCY